MSGLALDGHLFLNMGGALALFNGSKNVDMQESTKQHSFLFFPPSKTSRNYLRKF
jgi:hypothetical protein